MARLEVTGLHVSYGLSRVLSGVSFEVGEGEVVALTGRNGAGKTTTLRSIMGLTPARRGRVGWNGRDVTAAATHRIARLGIGYVPEERRIFPGLSLEENLRIAKRPGKGQRDEQYVYELFPDLRPLARRPGGVLSGGQQQLLAIARSLLGNPKLLLLDEPSEGLAPMVVKSMQEQLAALRETGLSILLAEQNLRFALALSDRVHVMERGGIRYSATAEELREDDSRLREYLAV